MERIIKDAFSDKLETSSGIFQKIRDAWPSALKNLAEELGTSNNEEAVPILQASVEKYFRNLLLELWSENFISSEGAGRLVDVCIKSATEEIGELDEEETKQTKESKYICSEIVPYRILEDMFHLATPLKYPDLWDILEDRQETLTNEILFGKKKSKLTVLRLANYLLKGASQSYQPAFCGRVMMFLAYALSIDERSGVNLLGWVNKENVTKIETEEEYKDSPESKPVTDTEKRENLADKDISTSTNSLVKNTVPIDYTLYKNFWLLQQDFLTKPESPGGIVTKTGIWNAFKQRADTVLRAFEENPFSEADLQRELEARTLARNLSGQQDEDKGLSNAEEAASAKDETLDSDGDVKMEEEGMRIEDAYQGVDSENKLAVDSMFKNHGTEFFPTKYLSNSRLLRLELTDPSVRRSVLLQFLILFQKAERVCTAKELPSGKLTKKPEVNIMATNSGLASLKKRILKLLEDTPSDGENFVKSVHRTLARESNWQAWKEEKCPPIIKKVTEEVAVGKKRRLKTLSAKARKKILQNMQLWAPQGGSWEEELAEENRNVTPEWKSFIKPMMDAIDPENCIEEAYHPKHDELFCFRGLRLMFRSYPASMNAENHGSLEKCCISLEKESKKSETTEPEKEKGSQPKVVVEPSQTAPIVAKQEEGKPTLTDKIKEEEGKE